MLITKSEWLASASWEKLPKVYFAKKNTKKKKKMAFDFPVYKNRFQNFEESSVVFRDRLGRVDLFCGKGLHFPTGQAPPTTSLYQKHPPITTCLDKQLPSWSYNEIDHCWQDRRSENHSQLPWLKEVLVVKLHINGERLVGCWTGWCAWSINRAGKTEQCRQTLPKCCPLLSCLLERHAGPHPSGILLLPELNNMTSGSERKASR